MWTHWRHLANTIELVLPSSYPSPQPKRQIDRFSRFCTARGKKSLNLTVGDPFPNCPFLWGSGSPSNSWFLGRVRAHVQSKRHYDRFSRFRTGDRRVSLYFTMGYPAPLKIAPYHGDLDPIEHTFPRAHRSPQPKRHFERFSCVCSAHYSSVTDRQTTLLGR